MSTKILRIIIYTAGLIGLFCFFAIRIEFLFNLTFKEKILPEYWENTKYGELYYFNYIKNFREEGLPTSRPNYRHTAKHPPLAEADILIFGDSFMDFSRMVTFPERLSDTLGRKVYYERFFNDHRPLILLKEKGYKNNNTPKIAIYESAERYIPIRFANPHIEEILPEDTRSPFRKAIAAIRDWIFIKEAELKYSTILNRSVFTTDIHSMINTLKFNYFGYILSTTPDYAFNEKCPWLFYYEEVNEDSTSYYYQFTDEQINNYCNNISGLAKQLKEKYNLEMIFLPVPSKYSIYHKIINDDPYNIFLPRIYEGLAARGVPYIDVYHDYTGSDETLYFGTDTHWNNKGLDIALENTMEVIDELGYHESDLLTQNNN